MANVYVSSAAGSYVIVDKSDNAANMEYRLSYIAGGGFRFRVGSGTVDSPPVSANTWYTVVAWHDSVNDTLNIQVNSLAVQSVSYAGGAMDTTFPLAIGAHSDGTSGG